MKYEEYNYIVPTWAAIYFSNGDISGLNEEEIEDLNKFESQLIKTHGHANMIVGNEDPSFKCYNDINNYGGDCVKGIILVEKQKKG